jgi:hypothetical protein
VTEVDTVTIAAAAVTTASAIVIAIAIVVARTLWQKAADTATIHTTTQSLRCVLADIECLAADAPVVVGKSARIRAAPIGRAVVDVVAIVV